MDYTSYQGRSTNKISGGYRPATYLPNVKEWVEHIYCLEAESDQYTADQVLGGINGISNAPNQALANRTTYLLDYLQRLAAVVSAIQINIGPVLSSIKALHIQRDEVDDYDHEAWLQLEDCEEADELYEKTPGGVVTNCRLEFADGSYVENPILELTLENGQTIYLRTDGQSVIIPSAEALLDQ